MREEVGVGGRLSGNGTALHSQNCDFLNLFPEVFPFNFFLKKQLQVTTYTVSLLQHKDVSTLVVCVSSLEFIFFFVSTNKNADLYLLAALGSRKEGAGRRRRGERGCWRQVVRHTQGCRSFRVNSNRY